MFRKSDRDPAAEELVLRYIAEREEWERDQIRREAPYRHMVEIPWELVSQNLESYRELMARYFTEEVTAEDPIPNWSSPPSVQLGRTEILSSKLTRSGAIVKTFESKEPPEISAEYEYVLVRVGDELRLKDRRSDGLKGLF